MVENVIQIKSGITIILVSVWKSERTSGVQKYYIWYPAVCNCKHGKYLVKVIDDSVITCDEIIEEAKTIPNKKKPVKQKKFFSLLTVLLITLELLMAVSIYCYLIKYKAKQKHLLLYYTTNDKFKEVLF